MTETARDVVAKPGDEIPRVIGRLVRRRQAWAERSVRDKLQDLEGLRDALEREGPAWARASCLVRGVESGGSTPHLEAAAWLSGVGLLGAHLGVLIRSYRHRDATGRWFGPLPSRQRSDGQRVVTVFPTQLCDRLYSPGHRGQLWLGPGGEIRQGSALEDGGAVCAVLGAGNYEAPVDVLTKMFGENRVVAYKPNPVNEMAAESVERIFGGLIEAGFLAVVRGGAELGGELVHHPRVDEVLMTGGAATYDRIVWGAPEEQTANKRSGAKLLGKRFDAELGGVMPVIVVPGRWTAKELRHQAAQIAAAKVINGSHICASPQVIVVDRGWPQRGEFLDAVRAFLRTTPPDPSYYPGAAERQNRLADAHDTAERLAPPERPFDGQLDRVLIPDVPLDARVVKEEAFCPVLAELALDGDGSPQHFLARAVDVCNHDLFGSLAATVLVDPRTARSSGPALEDAIARLEYGAVGVNVWALTSLFGELAWGAYPKHTPEDIQSGVGKIGNGFLVDDVRKSVLWSPFVSPNHFQPARPRDLKVWPRMARYCTRPTTTRLAKLMSAALLGV